MGVCARSKLEVVKVLDDPEMNAKGLRAEMDAASGRPKGCGGGVEGKYGSSVDAREPQNPTKSEEYQKRLQGFPGASSVCIVRVPWKSGGGLEGVRRGSGGGRTNREGVVLREHGVGIVRGDQTG
eukprot:1176036-Prorocentrum_minimum.AAC.4